MAMRLLAVIGFVCLYGIPAFANGGGQGCTQLRHVHGWISVQDFLGLTMRPDHIYQGPDAARIAGNFNVAMNESIEADSLVVFGYAYAPRYLLVFALGDCLVRMRDFTLEESDKIINGGDPS